MSAELAPRELPLTVTERRPVRFDSSVAARARLAIIGSAGVVGTVTHELLSDHFDISGLDPARQDKRAGSPWWTIGSISDIDALDETIAGADYVLLAATGIKAGWPGLQEVEIAGTAAVCAAAVRHRIKRLVLVSSNHSTGMFEVDQWEGEAMEPARPSSPPRPDGLYGCSKVFAESAARSASEIYGLPTSVIRLGAMRITDDPAECTDGPRPTSMTDQQYGDRMQAVWVSHDGWSEMLQEELSSREVFRLRYGSDSFDDAPWVRDVLTQASEESS